MRAREVPPATAAALHGVDEVVVVGYGVVSAEVESALRADPDTEVRRVAGGDRAETAASMARAFPAEGRGHLVAGGDASLVDAVAAGWSAARDDGGPVLYVGARGPAKAATAGCGRADSPTSDRCASSAARRCSASDS